MGVWDEVLMGGMNVGANGDDTAFLLERPFIPEHLFTFVSHWC